MDAEDVRERWAHGAARAAAAARGVRGRPRSIPGEPTFIGAAPAAGPMDLVGADIAVLGVPFEDPPGREGADEGPSAIRRHSGAYALGGGLSFTPEPPWEPLVLERLRVLDYGDVAVEPGDVGASFVRAHEKLADIFAAGAVPLVLGGDHSVTVPVLQVLAAKLAGKLGVVAFDASFDLGSGPRHAAGSQWRAVFELGVVEPANFVQIGLSGCQLLTDRCVAEELGHRHYTMAEVDEAGAATVAQEALERAATGTEAVYVSLDAAVLDATAGDPVRSVPGGLTARELLQALAVLSTGPMAGFDVCGVAPRRDPRGMLCRLAARAVVEVMAGLARQRP